MSARRAAEIDSSTDIQIAEMADELMRIARRLDVRLTGGAPFLQSVALVLQREHRLANSLKSAVGRYDRLLNALFENTDKILNPPPLVIDIPFEHEPAQATAIES